MKNTLVIIGSLAAATTLPPTTAQHGTAHAQERAAPRVIDVVVEGGYTPSTVTVRAGERVVLRFLRREYGPCTAEVVLSSLGIRRTLPPFQAVEIELPALAPGEHEFHCGMGMIRGRLVVTRD